MTPLRVLLADDQTLFRRAIVSLLAFRDDIEVVGEAKDGFEAIALAQETLPDVVLMDLNMPHCSGLDAVRIIKKETPSVKVIILTVSDDDQSVFAAIKNGADGYLLKDLEPRQLFMMLERVRWGEPAIEGALAAKILQEFRQPATAAKGLPEAGGALTPRETEVLEFIVRGASNPEIASSLYISENTVKLHLRNILAKLHLQNRIQAAVYAVRHGLVGEQPHE
ncbi:MAG: response regulator transcription factor [Coriobacteriaceae bacterium]|jgi:DNA-binding NarL/FixJ family response regulator|nr:response regulator transcription factor [Coriobacteriaceae bacterium]